MWKHLIDKLILECEDEILNTTETLHSDWKRACAKRNCLIHTISLVIICLLLLAFIFCVSGNFCYTEYRSKQNHLFSFHDINNKLKGIYNNDIIWKRIINLKI